LPIAIFSVLPDDRQTMILSKFCIGLVTIAVCVPGLAGTVAITNEPVPFSVLALSTNDRVLVMAPHPDDESLS